MPRRERLLTLPFLLASIVHFLHGLALYTYLHLPGFLDERGADPVMIGLVFGAASGAAIAIRPFAGRAMDSVGRRIVFLVGGAIHVLACALYLSVDSIGPWLIAVRLLQGVAQGVLFSALFTYAADMVPASRRTEGMGLFGVSGMLPMPIGGLLGDLVLPDHGYRVLFALTLLIAIGGLVGSFFLREPARPRTSAARGFLHALGQRDLVPIWFVGTMFSMSLGGMFSFLKNFVEAEHIGSVGLYFSFYAGAACVLRVFFGWVPERVGPLRAFFPALFAIGVSLALLAIAREPVTLCIAGVFAGLGHGFAFPILSALVVTRASIADRGSAISLFTAAFDTGMLLGGPVLGAIADATDLRTMFLVSTILPLGGGLVFHLWERAREATERRNAA